MINFLKIGAVLLGFMMFNVIAQEGEPLELKLGLWEGIRGEDFSYKLLELNANGEHRMFNARIVSGFKKGRFLPFSDSDIQCTTSECTINITNQINQNENTRLILSPYLDDSYKVLEINTDRLGKPVLTQTYQIDKQENKSTVREFLHMYKGRLESLNSMDKNDFYGFWVGILNLDGKLELVSLEIHPDKKSHFVRFINGQSYTNRTTFAPADVVIEEDLIKIQTANTTFANKLLIHNSTSFLEGYLYSVHKGTTLQKGTFRLYRVKN